MDPACPFHRLCRKVKASKLFSVAQGVNFAGLKFLRDRIDRRVVVLLGMTPFDEEPARELAADFLVDAPVEDVETGRTNTIKI